MSDGARDAEIAAGFEAWLDELDAEPVVVLLVSAADELCQMRAASPEG